MKKGNKRRVWILIGALLPLTLMAQNPPGANKSIERHELSVQQAVDYAFKNNVQVKNAIIDVLLQKETNRQTTALALPTVAADGSLTDNLKLQTNLLPGEFFGQPAGTFVPVKFGTKYYTSGAVDLKQILFDGQVFVGLQARRTSIDWVEKNVEVTQEQVKANVYKVYYQLAVSKKQVELLDANISLLDKQRHDVQVLFENGFRSKLDVDRAGVQLTNLQTEKQKTLASISNGYYGLKVLMGMPLKDELVLTDSISEAQIKEGVLETAYQYDDRKDYQYLQLTRKFYAYNISRYKLSKIPTLSLEGSYSKQYQSDELKFGGTWFTSAFVALRLHVPIFNGFATNSKIQAARLEVQKVDNQLDNMKISIDSDVESARNTFRAAIATIDYQQKNMQVAETNYRQVKNLYDAGTVGIIDLNVAQTDLKSAQTNYINALYDAVIAKIDFLRATGKL